MRMRVAKDLKIYMMALADLLLPRKCVVCGRHLLVDENHFCAHCLAGMPLTYSWMQEHNVFADRFNERLEAWRAERDSVEVYAYVAVMFYYSAHNEYKNMTRQVKYHGNAGLGKWLGMRMGLYLKYAEHFSTADLVVPVPLHWSRRLSRGYNQAEVIASEIAAELKVPIRNLLVRRRRTKTQTKLDAEAKVRNVRAAFSIKKRVNLKRLGHIRHILLVDDVFTTGSTTLECFKALREALGPQVRISVACIGGV